MVSLIYSLNVVLTIVGDKNTNVIKIYQLWEKIHKKNILCFKTIFPGKFLLPWYTQEKGNGGQQKHKHGFIGGHRGHRTGKGPTAASKAERSLNKDLNVGI